MGSACWRARRAAWRTRWVAEHGREPVCAACGCPWALHCGDLHHRSYDRLGRELDADLTPLCRGCHDQVHVILESSAAWRRMNRAQATDLIIAHLRNRKRRHDHPHP
jgi:predicted HNH restriction endonuclease